MATFNISANFNVNPPSKGLDNALTFKAAKACRITFTPGAATNCFGLDHQDFQDNQTLTLNLVNFTPTTGTAGAIPTVKAAAVGGGSAAVRTGVGDDDDTFNITFGTDS